MSEQFCRELVGEEELGSAAADAQGIPRPESPWLQNMGCKEFIGYDAYHSQILPPPSPPQLPSSPLWTHNFPVYHIWAMSFRYSFANDYWDMTVRYSMNTCDNVIVPHLVNLRNKVLNLQMYVRLGQLTEVPDLSRYAELLDIKLKEATMFTNMEVNMDEQIHSPLELMQSTELDVSAIKMMIRSLSKKHAITESCDETQVGVGTTMAKKQNKRRMSLTKGGRSKKPVYSEIFQRLIQPALIVHEMYQNGGPEMRKILDWKHYMVRSLVDTKGGYFGTSSVHESLTPTSMVKKQNKRKVVLTECGPGKKSHNLEDLQQHSHMRLEEKVERSIYVDTVGKSTLKPYQINLEDLSLSEKNVEGEPFSNLSLATSPYIGAVGCGFASTSSDRCDRSRSLANPEPEEVTRFTNMELNMDKQSTEPAISAPETVPDGTEMTIPSLSAEQQALTETCVEIKVGDVGTTMEKKQNKRKISPTKGGRSKKPISFEDLLQCSHLSLEEAARLLHVGKSTVKRRCRDMGISEWPELKDLNMSEKSEAGAINQDVNSVTVKTAYVGWSDFKTKNKSSKIATHSSLTTSQHGGDVSYTCGCPVLNGSDQCNNLLMPVLQAANANPSAAASSSQPDEMSMQHPQAYGGMRSQPRNQPVTTPPPGNNWWSMTVMAKYGKKNMKFDLTSESKKEDLENEVTKREDLPVGSFYLEYKDEAGEWIYIGCNEDLKRCMDSFRSSGTSTRITMRVRKID